MVIERMPSFEEEVLTRLTRIETKQDAGTNLSADHESRLRALEASKPHTDIDGRIRNLEVARARMLGAAAVLGFLGSAIIEGILFLWRLHNG